jgi:hypothetical protein
MSNGLKIGVAAVGAAVLIATAIWYLRPEPGCAFSGWKRSVGVELDAQVAGLQEVKTKVGLSDATVREFDTLMKDYALKYDAACQDASATPPRISAEEYRCLRRNMDAALNEIRQMTVAIDAARTVTDASAQQQLIVDALEALRSGMRTAYREGCPTAVDVNPKTLEFRARQTERILRIANRSERQVNYTISDYPKGFMPAPDGGKVDSAASVSVGIIRTADPLPETRPLTFRVNIGRADERQVVIEVDEQNAEVWPALGRDLHAQMGARRTPATLEDALGVLKTNNPELRDGAGLLFQAATLLTEVKSDAAAQDALQTAVARDQSFLTLPPVRALSGVLASRLPEGAALYAELRAKQPDAAPPPTPGELGTVRLDRRVTADGRTLAPGTYTVRLASADGAPGQIEGKEKWIEFVQNGVVKGREPATIIPTGELKDAGSPLPAPGAWKVDQLRGNEYLRLWLNTPANQVLVHLPSGGTVKN